MNIIKTTTALFVSLTFSLQGYGALIGPTQINQGGNSPNAEIAVLEAWTPSLASLIFLGRFEYANANSGTWDASSLFTGSYFGVSGYTGTPATSTLTWDLLTTGYSLEAVLVKTARSYLTVYTVADDQKLKDLGGQSVIAPDNKDTISHISFFGKSIAVPDTGSTIMLFSSAIILLSSLKRKLS